jgi:hypothetical protein
LTEDAAKIVSLVDRYKGSESAMRTDIRAIWHDHWSPSVFASRSRSLLQTILRG